MKDLKSKTVSAFLWDFGGRLLTTSTSFIVSIFLARLLSPEEFGLIAMVNVVVAISNSVLDMGFGLALVQRKEVDASHYGSVFIFNMGLSFLLAAIVILSAPVLSGFYDSPEITPLFRFMALIFISNAFIISIKAQLTRELDFSKLTRVTFLASLLSGILGVVLAYLGFGVWSLAIQILSSSIFTAILIFLLTPYRNHLKFKWRSLKDLWGFGSNIFVGRLIDTVYMQMDSLIIGKIFNASTLGLYFRAKSLNNYIVQYSSASLTNVLLPSVSSIQEDRDRVIRVVGKMFHLLCFLTFGLIGLFFLIGGDLIIFLFGSKWQESVPYFRLILLSGFVYPLGSILINIVLGMGYSKWNTRAVFVKKALQGLNFYVGFSFGIKGFLIGMAIWGSLSTIINIYVASKVLKSGYLFFYNKIAPYFLISGITSLTIFLLNISFIAPIINLIVLSSIFILIYYLLLKLFNVKGLDYFIKEFFIPAKNRIINKS